MDEYDRVRETYEKRWVERAENTYEKNMLRTINRYLCMMYDLRAKEDWISLNEVEGEFSQERAEHLQQHTVDMRAIRFSFVRRSMAYTETCNSETVTLNLFIHRGWLASKV